MYRADEQWCAGWLQGVNLQDWQVSWSVLVLGSLIWGTNNSFGNNFIVLDSPIQWCICLEEMTIRSSHFSASPPTQHPQGHGHFCNYDIHVWFNWYVRLYLSVCVYLFMFMNVAASLYSLWILYLCCLCIFLCLGSGYSKTLSHLF